MQFDYKTSKAVPSSAIELLGGELAPYIASLRRVVEVGGYAAPEASLVVPGDEYMLAVVEQLVEKVYTKSLRYIFVIGIGGSSLGTKAIYDAMAQARDRAPHRHPRIIFVETTDGTELQMVKAIIGKAEHANELLFLVVSKSGTTTETIFNAEVLLDVFAQRFGRNARRVVVLSEDGSPLLRGALEHQMHAIPLPRTVGGRYSVFTPVGLLPLALLGFDVRAIRKAAADQVSHALHPDVTLNSAALSALTQYYFYTQGIRQHDLFCFAPALESVGKWYRQLLGESIGKPNIDKSENRVGITPTVSIGSTDLHSVGQLYLGGPRDRLTTFVSVAASGDVAMPVVRVWPDIVPMVSQKSAHTILGAIEAGTKAAYDTAGLPYLSVELSAMTPEEVAAFMQFKMCEVMMLGYLLKVNPFDQPQVEQYKTVTRQILEQN